MAITIKDIAQMANTSTATVSRVLAEKPGVTEEKRKRILELAQRLGYSPNRIAQNLALQKSHVIGLIAADLRNASYVDFLRRTQRRVEDMGYQVLIADSEVDVEVEKHNIRTMRQHRAEGLLIFPVVDWLGQTEVDHLLELKLQKYPFVIVGRIEGFGFDYVISEETETAYKLTKTLLDQGHKRIAFVGNRDTNRPVRERREGVVNALRESGLRLEERCVLELGETDEWLPELVQLLKSENRPTGLVMVNDTCALIAYQPIKDLGLSIPKDISMVAFGDDIWSRHLSPALTTTREDNVEITNIAMDLLFKRIEDPLRPSMQKLVPQEIIVRESVGPAPR